MIVDIHTHILPGLDDGSQSIEETLEMVQRAMEEGITHIIATPHHANGRFDNEADRILEAVRELNESLQTKGINVHIYPGQEIRVYQDLLNDFNEGKLLSLNSSQYMLIEFPSSSIPNNIEDLMHELQLLQITPVIAHPERNKELANDIDKLYSLVQSGALCQVTSHSIIGGFGQQILNTAIEMCRRNLVHMISSDAHNLTYRPFKLIEAYDNIQHKLGSDYRDYYVANAVKLLTNQSFEVWPALEKKKKRFLKWRF